MSLTVYTSNRMELLADSLAETVRAPLASPLATEVIVVQSAGMQRWLSMELAARFGVWANCRYPYPNTMLRELFRAVIPELPEACPFAPETLGWRIMGLLPELMQQPGFEAIRRYLAHEAGSLKLFQLAERIADTFDQYTLFRPQMLLGWEAGAEGGWQATLWRELARHCGGMHRGRILEEFLRRRAPLGAQIPARIAVFGISYLPPFHLDVLAAVSRLTEVNLFLLNPCREYWATIVSERDQARLRRTARDNAPAVACLETGNALLASLGRMGRDFLDAVLERFADHIRDDFRAEPGASLLEMLRNDILNLADAPEKRLLDPADRSLQVHSCHGPLRELEVLYDSLLALFEADPTLTPRDVLVMTPDIESYAPYITAVFDAARGTGRALPHAVADRGLSSEGHVSRGLMAILSLPGGRFGANRVMDILESPPVRKRFGLEAGDLETVRRWVEETRIRWGRDEGDRLRHGAPGFRENSWRAGLDRLLLGYALPDGGEEFFHGMLPSDGIEGDDARVLGGLLRFIAVLSAAVDLLEAPRSPAAWEAACRTLLEDFFVVDEEEERERLELLALLAGLGEAEERSGFAGPVEVEVIRSWLEARLDRHQRGAAGFLTGRITFCAMLPMRSIPFRVIALIGMNDGAFPRRNRPPEFDLTALEPRRGDRSLRDEDRYLFLEALLSAGQKLHISYVGQGMKDNEDIPPSVLVSELLDCVDQGFSFAGHEGPPRDILLVRHRLHPFSPAYFGSGSPLFSYSEENREAAETLRAAGSPPGPFLTAPLPPLPEETTISLDELTACFANPARFFLKTRFGISPRDPEGGPEESEPFRLDALERYGLEQELSAALLKGRGADEIRAVLRARGELPAGSYGDELFDLLADGVGEFAAAVRPCLDAPALPPRELDLRIGDLRLVGRIGDIRSTGLVRYRCAKLKARDRIRLWIEHLALNGLGVEGYPAESLALGKDGEIRLAPVPRWRELLAELLATCRQGMREPLPFFPSASFSYADKLRNPKTEGGAMRAAQREWHGSEGFPGEKGDASYRLCFGDADPLDERFRSLAVAIWGPVFEHTEKS